jgi:hypothetical protein
MIHSETCLRKAWFLKVYYFLCRFSSHILLDPKVSSLSYLVINSVWQVSVLRRLLREVLWVDWISPKEFPESLGTFQGSGHSVQLQSKVSVTVTSVHQFLGICCFLSHHPTLEYYTLNTSPIYRHVNSPVPSSEKRNEMA